MRKLFMALAAVAALGLTIPLSTPADAQSATVVVKKRYGDRYVQHPRKKVVIIKRDRHRRDYVRAHARPNTVVIVKKKRTPRAAVTVRSY